MLPAREESSEFPATHWTLIAAASGPARDSALSRLYQAYWLPMCAQARRFGVPEAEVEDVAQELFLSLFRSGAVERADRERGRFRSYLLGALRNHLGHRRARELTLKRGGGEAALPLDGHELVQPPADAREFDAEWAHALLGEALRRFQHEEQHSEESRASFAALGGPALGDEEFSCEEVALRLGITVPAVKSRVFRLRQRFHDIVREEVRRTVANEAECDDELRYLSAVLAKVDGVPAFPLPA
jgi:RNA polymerase sigma-70 factor (ECF subfamily)